MKFVSFVDYHGIVMSSAMLQILFHNLVLMHVNTILILQGKAHPLWAASYKGRLEVVEDLLDRGAEVNQTTDVRTIVLLPYCRKFSLEKIFHQPQLPLYYRHIQQNKFSPVVIISSM